MSDDDDDNDDVDEIKRYIFLMLCYVELESLMRFIGMHFVEIL
jgi:hypothetical protein